MKIGRRDFVTRSSEFLFSFASFFAGSLSKSSLCQKTSSVSNRAIVFIHLAGGNDWFNTIIPYSNAAYYKSRPNLAIQPSALLKINEQFGFHPALFEINTAYEKNQVAILLNCGLSGHDLSHDKAIKQAQYIDRFNTGAKRTWQARYAQITKNSWLDKKSPAINVEPLFYEDELNKVLIKSKEKLLVNNLSENNGFLLDLDIHYKIKDKTVDLDGYLENGFVSAMNMVADQIANDNVAISHVSLGGFDTHENQLEQHEYLLRMLDLGIKSLQSNLKKNGIDDRVLIVVGSEFGRSLKENQNAGTDHGYVNHALVIGDFVNAGIYGKLFLNEKGKNQNIISYDDLLAAVLDHCLGCSSEAVLGKKYSSYDIIKKTNAILA